MTARSSGVPNGSLAFVVPVMFRPVVEEGSEPVVKSESDPSTSLPTVNASIINPSPSSSPDAASSQEWVLSDNEKGFFIDAVFYLASKTLGQSKSQTAEALKIILSVSKKANAKHFEGKEITAEMLATAVMEIAVKNKIQEALSKIHPAARLVIGVSELVDLFRAPLQDALKLEYDKNQQKRLGIRGDRGHLFGLRLGYNELLASGYTAIEAASWINRLIDLCAKESVVAGKAGTGLVQRGVIAYGEAWKDFLRDAFDGMTVSDFFPATLEGRLMHLYTKMQADAAQPRLRSETGQEDGGDYELYDQLTEEQEALDYFLYEAEKQNQANAYSQSGDEKKPRSNNIPHDLTAYRWPNPIHPHPITNVLGGSFSVTGGSEVPTQATAQINITLYGPKNLPTSSPAVNAARVFGQSDTTGGPYGPNAIYHPEQILAPIRRKLSDLDASYAKYKAKVEELQSVQKEGIDSPGSNTQTIMTADGKRYESPDSIINRKKREIDLANELGPLTRDAMEKAWAVRRLTNHEAVKKNLNVCAAQCHTINNATKDLLHNEFGVPHHGKLHKNHLNESTRLTTWAGVVNSAVQSRDNAQKDKEIFNTQREFNAADHSVVGVESASGPVDPNRLASALQSLQVLGKQLAAQIHARGAGTPQEIEDKVQAIEDRIAALSRRDIRYVVILAGCEEFRELEAYLLSKIQANGNEQGISEDLKQAATQKAALETQIADLIAQAPGNAEKNAELLQFRDAVSAKFTNVSLAKQSKDVSRTYQQYCEEQAAIREMENGDGPVDSKRLAEALARFEALGDLLVAQVRVKAALSPQTISIADLSYHEKHIQGQIEALNRRDARYDKIRSGYEDFCSVEKDLLPELIVPDNAHGASEGLKLAAQKKRLLEQQIADLSAERPGNVEKNAALAFIQKDVGSRFGALAFCVKPQEEKTAELHRLRDQIGGASSPAESNDAISAYQRRASLLSLQLATCQDYGRFSTNFNDFVTVLIREESVGQLSVDILNDMTHDLMAGVAKKKIDPETAIPYLEAFEKKYSSGTFDLGQIRLTIGGLFCCTRRSTTHDAMQWYQKCQSLQPQNPLWPRCQALCLLETLHYTEAENTILKVLEMDSDNEASKKAAAAIVMDKYLNASLAIEWLQVGIQALTPEQTDTVSRLREYTSFLKAAQGVLSVASHPILLTRILPGLLALPEGLSTVLTKILEEDKTAHFTWFNGTTFATRAISAATGYIMNAYPKDQYPDFHRRATQLTFISSVVQIPTSLYQIGSSLYDLWSKYYKQDLTLFSSFRSGITMLATPLTIAIPFGQSFFYKDKEAKLISQRSRPVLNSVIETLASKKLASAVALSDLAWRSSSLLARLSSRLMPTWSSKGAEKIIAVASVIFLVWKVREAYFKSNDEIMGRPPRPDTGIMGYLYPWWDYFAGKEKHA